MTSKLAELAIVAGSDRLRIVVLPARSKTPAGPWRYATPAELAELAGHNLGLVYGDGLTGLDADAPASWAIVKARLAALGIETWQVARPANGSAHDGGGLAIVRSDRPAHGRSSPGLDVKTAGYSLIPPSTHPAGGQYEYLQGGPPSRIATVDPADLAPWLLLGAPEPATSRAELEARLTALRIPPGRRIPPKAARILAGDVDSIKRYATRSEAEQGALTSLVSAGWTFERCAAVFVAMPAAGKFSELWRAHPGRAVAWLERSYCAAAAFILEHPHPIRARALELRTWAELAPWPGRTGGTDRAVLVALCTLAAASCQPDFGASCRELAELAAVNFKTAAAALRRLAARGVVKCAGLATLELSARYILTQDPESECINGTISHMGSTSTESVPFMHSESAPDHDVWRFAGLGKSALAMFTVMGSGTRWTVKALATATGKHVVTVRRNLKHLMTVGLVTPEGDGIWSCTADAPDLDGTAADLDVLGMGDRQRVKHQAQRRAWADRLERARRVER